MTSSNAAAAHPRWQPMETLPAHGHVLLATCAPTNYWVYYVNSVRLSVGDPPRARETATRYAKAWMFAPLPPPDDWGSMRNGP